MNLKNIWCFSQLTTSVLTPKKLLTLVGIGVILSSSTVSATPSSPSPTQTGNKTIIFNSKELSHKQINKIPASPGSPLPKQQNNTQNLLCYMVSPDGKMIDLQALCGQTSPSTTNNNSNRNSTSIKTTAAQATNPTQGNSVETP